MDNDNGIPLIKVEKLIDVLRLCILSGKLKREQPVSMLLISEPECGKSRIINLFSLVEGIVYSTDLSAYGIIRDFMPKIERKEIRHIIVPDMLKILSRKESTVRSLITFLNALVEEGVVDISIYYKVSDGRKKIPVNCGFISAITKGEIFDRRHKWLKDGFMSRMLPVSYSYSETTRAQIMEFIQEEKHLNNVKLKIKLPKQQQNINLNKKYAMKLMPYTYGLAKSMELYGFRLQRQFQALLKSSALDYGRKEVTQDDVDRLIGLMDFINLDFKVI